MFGGLRINQFRWEITLTDRAACQTLDDGQAGILLNDSIPEAIANAVRQTENQPKETEERKYRGMKLVDDRYELGRNASLLAEILGSLDEHKL